MKRITSIVMAIVCMFVLFASTQSANASHVSKTKYHVRKANHHAAAACAAGASCASVAKVNKHVRKSDRHSCAACTSASKIRSTVAIVGSACSDRSIRLPRYSVFGACPSGLCGGFCPGIGCKCGCK